MPVNRKIDQKSYRNQGNPSIMENIPKTATSFLDVGCGAGDNGRLIKSQGRSLVGITISESEAEIARTIFDKVYIHNLENGLPFMDEKFDIIICSHVLEHIAYPQNLLSDVKNVMLPDNSKIIVALPNIMHYNFRKKLLFGNFNYSDSGVMDYTHLRWYTFISARSMFIEQGFIVEKAYVDGKIPFHSIFKFLPSHIYGVLKNFFYTLSKGLFGEQLVYILKV